MKTLSIRRGWGAYDDVLANREPFKTSGSLFGHEGAHYGTGYLPGRFADEYRERHDHITYTVVSYGTPIAWHDDEFGWIIPDVVYSVTTSRQQGNIRSAFARGEYDTAPRV